MKLVTVVGARPQFIKAATFSRAVARHNAAGRGEPIDEKLLHTGQHYDANMSDAFFRDLGLPTPAHHLEIGSGSHAEQTGRTMIAYEQLCMKERPDAIIVVGDVNATVACAMVGAKLGIPTVHLEAGLRSRDRTMPEEINRLATDAIADLLWTPSEDADENLRALPVAAERVERVGNIMIDSYEMMRDAIAADDAYRRFDLQPGGYGVATLHRPANVDTPEAAGRLVAMLDAATAQLPVVFDASLLTILPHMHLLGSSISVTATLPDGATKPLIRIPRWDFNWQQGYFYEGGPKVVGGGDMLRISCTYDTMDKGTPTMWGEGTDDEMCLAFMYVSQY